MEYNIGDKVVMLWDSWDCKEGKVYEIEVKDKSSFMSTSYRLRNDNGDLMWISPECFELTSDCHKCRFDCKLPEKCWMYEEIKEPLIKRVRDGVMRMIGR